MNQNEIDILSLRKAYDVKSYDNIYKLEDEIPNIRNKIIDKITYEMNIEPSSITYLKVEDIIYDMMADTNRNISNIKQTQYMDEMDGINTTDTKQLFNNFLENKEYTSKHYSVRVEDMLDNIVRDTMLRFSVMLDPNREGKNQEVIWDINRILILELKDKIIEIISEYDKELDDEFSKYLQEEIDRFEKEKEENEEQEKYEKEAEQKELEKDDVINNEPKTEQNSFEEELRSKTINDDELLQNDLQQLNKKNDIEIEKNNEKEYSHKNLSDLFK